MYEGKFYFKDFPATLKQTWGYRDSGFPFSGIYMFSGGQGSGKTLNAVQFVLDIKAKYPTCMLVSNIPLNIDGVIPYCGLEDFDKYNNGTDGIIYLLDEIQSMYSSMQSKHVGDEQLYIWAQNRKNRRVIIGTTQRFSRVAKPIREQTKYLYDMRGHILNVFTYRAYDGYCFDDDGKYCEERPPIHFCCPSLGAYKAYDTRYVVHWKGDKLDGTGTDNGTR